MAKYDPILKSCLDQGAKCIIDLHNYAHWNGQVVGQSGQSGCSVSDLVSFWTQIVKRYESNSNFKNIVFGVMNEPHDVEMNIWYVTGPRDGSHKANSGKGPMRRGLW